MITLYDPLSSLTFERLLDDALSDTYQLGGTNLMEALGCQDVELFEQAIARAKRACVVLGIPIRRHFRVVYLCGGEGLQKEYQLSRLACYLTSINADPGNPVVARAQLFLFSEI